MTLTLSGKTSNLESFYFPPIELSPDKTYVLGLTELLTFNSIPNIDTSNNTIHIGGEVIIFPTGSYEIEDIEKFIQRAVEDKKIKFSLEANNNTLKSVIKCSHSIDFTQDNSLGTLLGFTKKILTPQETHSSSLPVQILKINALRIECNITSGAYINGEKVHTIHEFFPAVAPGFKIVEIPSKILYLPVTVRSIDHVQLRIIDQDGNPVNFRGETITIRLHLKTIK